MNSLLTVIVLICSINFINCVDHEDCGSTDGKVTSVAVNGCISEESVCTLKIGTTAGIDIKFTSNVDSSTNTVHVWGVVNGLAIPFPMAKDACKWGLTCPVTNGSNQELKISMPLSKSYPKNLNFKVKIAVVDSKGENLMCTQFAGKTVE